MSEVTRYDPGGEWTENLETWIPSKMHESKDGKWIKFEAYEVKPSEKNKKDWLSAILQLQKTGVREIRIGSDKNNYYLITIEEVGTADKKQTAETAQNERR